MVVNNTVILDCLVSGEPIPQITWLKNGNPFTLTDHMMVTEDGQQLHIERAVVQDAGRYTCEARNSAGETRREIILDVLG